MLLVIEKVILKIYLIEEDFGVSIIEKHLLVILFLICCLLIALNVCFILLTDIKKGYLLDLLARIQNVIDTLSNFLPFNFELLFSLLNRVRIFYFQKLIDTILESIITDELRFLIIMLRYKLVSDLLPPLKMVSQLSFKLIFSFCNYLNIIFVKPAKLLEFPHHLVLYFSLIWSYLLFDLFIQDINTNLFESLSFFKDTFNYFCDLLMMLLLFFFL